MKKILPIIAIAILFSCNSEKNKFNYAVKTNTIEDFETYIKENPKSVYVDSAKFRINGLLFKKAMKQNDLKSFYEYLLKTKEHPVDSFFAITNGKIDSLRFDSVKTEGTEDAYSGFYKKYPDSKYFSKAKQLSKDTIITGELSGLTSFMGELKTMMIQTKNAQYIVEENSNCEYINIESVGTNLHRFEFGKVHEVEGRIGTSLNYPSLKAIRTSYIKRLKK